MKCISDTPKNRAGTEGRKYEMKPSKINKGKKNTCKRRPNKKKTSKYPLIKVFHSCEHKQTL